MTYLFYSSAGIAIISALMVLTRANAMHALLYLVLMFLSIASIFWTLGAPFAAVLEIVVYAGAIMVLFVFVVMMLNLGHEVRRQERSTMNVAVWVLPVALAAILLAQFVISLVGSQPATAAAMVPPKPVGISLFTTYLIGVELASLLLLAGLVAAFHYGVVYTWLEDEDD